MSEKVLFEFRTEETEDGYTCVVKRDKEAFPCWGPPFIGGFFSRFRRAIERRMRKHRKFAKGRMRRSLDFYEQMYEDLYGPLEEGEE